VTAVLVASLMLGDRRTCSVYEISSTLQHHRRVTVTIERWLVGGADHIRLLLWDRPPCATIGSVDVRRRAAGILDRLRRASRQTTDKNFVGFDKYRLHGAYHWDSLGTEGSYREKIDLLIGMVGPDFRCLDLGCGDGAYVFELSQHCTEVVGVDADYDAIRCASQALDAAGASNVTCLQMPLSGVPTADLGSFDLVYSMDVLEHLPRPEELFEVALTRLHPGGRLVIGTPLYITDDLISDYHVTEYTAEQLREMFAKHLPLAEERILSGTRAGTEVYEEEFWIGVGFV